MLNLWHDVALMQTVGRVIARLALLLLFVAACVWFLQRPYFAINQFRFVGDVKQLNQTRLHELVKKHLSDGLSGGFFSMNLNQVQTSLAEVTWIKNASIRRVWPHEVEINIEAYQPIATWGNRFLSSEGQVFDGQITTDVSKKLLVASGPEEASKLVAEQIPKLQATFAAVNWQIVGVDLSERYSWRVHLSNGLIVELGRADTPTALNERLARLIQSAGFIQENLGDAGGYIDLRYPNGFAMRTDKLHRVAIANNTVKIGGKHD